MSIDAIVTLVVAALIVLAAALGLLRAIFHLKTTAETLDSLDGGVAVIVEKTATVAPVVESVNASLAPVRSFAESI